MSVHLLGICLITRSVWTEAGAAEASVFLFVRPHPDLAPAPAMVSADSVHTGLDGYLSRSGGYSSPDGT